MIVEEGVIKFMYFRKEVNMKNKQDVRSKFLQELGKLTNDNNQFLQVLGLVDEYIEKLYKHELKIADDRWKQTEEKELQADVSNFIQEVNGR